MEIKIIEYEGNEITVQRHAGGRLEFLCEVYSSAVGKYILIRRYNLWLLLELIAVQLGGIRHETDSRL